MHYLALRIILAIVLGTALKKSGINTEMWQFWTILAAYLLQGVLVRMETINELRKK